MHRLNTRRSVLIAAVAGLIGLVALVFGLIDTAQQRASDHAGRRLEADRPAYRHQEGPERLRDEGLSRRLARDDSGQREDGGLIKDAHVIIKSNPAEPLQDYPVSWKVTAYKGNDLYLERVGASDCDLPPGPAGAPGAGTRNLYTGPCPKPAVGTGAAADLSGVSDLIVDGGNPADDIYHCMLRTDVADSGDAKTSAICFDNTVGSAPALPPSRSTTFRAKVWTVTPVASGRRRHRRGAWQLRRRAAVSTVRSQDPAPIR